MIAPQAQRRLTSRCSTTRTVICGMSNTCRRMTRTGGTAAASCAPQPAQAPGSCATTSSGRSTCRRPDRPRSDFGAGLSSPSADGGFEELREEAANCRSNSAIRASCSAIQVCNATTRAASSS